MCPRHRRDRRCFLTRRPFVSALGGEISHFFLFVLFVFQSSPTLMPSLSLTLICSARVASPDPLNGDGFFVFRSVRERQLAH